MTTETATLSTGRAIRRALRDVPDLRHGLIGTLLLAMVGTGAQLIVPVLAQQLIDDEVLGARGVDIRGVLVKGGIALGALIASTIATWWVVVRLNTAAARGLFDLRVRTFRHLHRLSVLHVQAERRGALVGRVTSDLTTLQEFIEWGGIGMLIGVAQVLLAIGLMIFYEAGLAVLVVGAVAVYAGLLAWFQRILQRAHDRVRERVADSLAVTGEAISGLPVVRAYGAELETLDRVDAALQRQFYAEFRTARLGAFLFSSAEMFAGIITAGVIGFGVVRGAVTGVSPGTLLAFLLLVNLLVDPVQTLVETLDHAQSAASGLRRVLRVLDTTIDIEDPVDGVDLPPGPLDVRFRTVRFRYPTGDDVLADVDIHIPAGRRVAIVGETGSGKTTFAKLLVRLLDPAEGSVEVGGVDLKQVRFNSLRSRVAFVPQDGFLFDNSLLENVRYGRPGASEREVQSAFFELGLDGWLEGLREGLETQVGERGSNLSAGERQLVALVRAWISVPDLLVLDEATSAVDPALDVSLRRAMERVTAGRTSVTVAHRLATAEAAEEILVFDQGHLVQRGTHMQLLAESGVYAALHADWVGGTSI